LATSFQPLHNFADVLGAAARAKQQRVLSLNHNQIADADCGDKFLRAPEEIALRVMFSPGLLAISWYTAAQEPISLQPTSAGSTNTPEAVLLRAVPARDAVLCAARSRMA